MSEAITGAVVACVLLLLALAYTMAYVDNYWCPECRSVTRRDSYTGVKRCPLCGWQDKDV